MISFKISLIDNDQTIISFLRKRFKTTPLSLIYKLFRKKKIKVNEEYVRYYHHRLKVGNEVLVLDKYLKKADFHSVYPLSKKKDYFSIIYEDENILIILKDYGISMPSLDNSVRNYIGISDRKKYNLMMDNFFVLSSSHRLDKVTKGLVLYTKKNSIKREINRFISDKEKIEKKYFALVEDKHKNLAFRDFNHKIFIKGYIKKDCFNQKMSFVPEEALKNNSSLSDWKFCSMEFMIINKESKKEVLSYFPVFSNIFFKKKDVLLLEIKLHTGRKHQIRSVLSFLDFPIIGDKKYGSSFENDFICLLAYMITFDNLPSPLSYLNGKAFSCF